MLMNMVFNATEGVVKHRKRYHFHEVMHYSSSENWKHWYI